MTVLRTEAPPGRIVVAGDWHGNAPWAAAVISHAGHVLRDEARPLIVSLGDFGIWPGEPGRQYVEAVLAACAAAGVTVMFIDGNHEDFTQLHQFDVRQGPAGRTPALYWLPRNTRWAWHGRTWHALGGAASVDRAVRVRGRSWWPEEVINRRQELEALRSGPADVMVTHDCPAGVRHSFGTPPSFWDAADLARSDAHREKLQGIVNALQPRWIMHGHLHRAYQRPCDFGYGPVEVTGLDCDGSHLNYAVLDTRTMAWEGPELREESQ